MLTILSNHYLIKADGRLSRLVTDKHLARVLSRNESHEELPIRLRS
jgi:hypothetical protein